MIEKRTAKSTRHGNLKQALVEYALDAAQSQSLSDLSLRKASRDLGVSSGAAYKHFADKDSLLRTVAHEGFDALAQSFEAALPFDSNATSADHARERFIALGATYVAFAKSNYGLWQLMFGPHGLQPEQKLDRPSTYDWLTKSLHELSHFGVVKPTNEAGQLFAWTAIHGLADLTASSEESDEMKQKKISQNCELIISALSKADI